MHGTAAQDLCAAREIDLIEIYKSIADSAGLTLDVVHDLLDGLPIHALRKVMGNASSIPSKRKSSDKPYLARRTSAPSKDRRSIPPSQRE